MVVDVRLHTILQRPGLHGPVRQLQFDLPDCSTLADLLEILEVKLSPEHLLLVVNGRLVDLDYELKEQDQVNLIPALSGG